MEQITGRRQRSRRKCSSESPASRSQEIPCASTRKTLDSQRRQGMLHDRRSISGNGYGGSSGVLRSDAMSLSREEGGGS